MYIDNTWDKTPKVNMKDKTHSVSVCWCFFIFYFFFLFHCTSAQLSEMIQPIWIPMSTLSQFLFPCCLYQETPIILRLGCLSEWLSVQFLYRLLWVSFLMQNSLVQNKYISTYLLDLSSIVSM